ncbi:MAG: hypothetical protein WCT16_03535 [Candidatus Buchananbacteria bacterium]
MNQLPTAGTTAGIIPGKEYATDNNNPIKKMARAVLAGRKELFSKEEIANLVNQRYFSFDPLVALTNAEEDFLKADMIECLLHDLNKGYSREFLSTECFLVSDVNGRNGLSLLSVSPRTVIPKNLKPMTPEEKIAFLSDPENLEVYWTRRLKSSPISKMGYRPLKDYDKFSSAKKFTQVIRRIQENTGRHELNILDLGGGVGTALHDAKILHPELITYNATRDEEYGCYDVDFQVVCFLERMPLALQGKIDYIFSNVATRYVAFSDLVIRGCIGALSTGGVLDVFFSSERSCNHDRGDVKQRMKKAYEYLKDLESAGAIKLSINSTSYDNAGSGAHEADNGSLFPASTVIATKL